MCNWTLNVHPNTSLLEVQFHVRGTSRSVLSSTYTILGHNLDQRFIQILYHLVQRFMQILYHIYEQIYSYICIKLANKNSYTVDIFYI